ncbi:MAG: hypothetical protein ACXAEX_22745 [Promethearchaeota archaeon]
MSSDPMTALDFVISVLRQHENELNELSLRLEEMIKEITGKEVKNDLGKIQSNLTNIQKNLQELNKKVSSSESSDKNLETIIEKIEGQTQRFDILTESMKNIPTINEVDDLRTKFSSLTSNLKRLLSEEARVLPHDSPMLQLVNWSDIKSHTSNPELVIYNLSETSITVNVEKEGKRYVYTEFTPPETYVDEDLSQLLYGKMKSGLELIKKIERVEKGRVKIKFTIPKDFDVKSWLSWELKAPVDKIIEGKNIS